MKNILKAIPKNDFLLEVFFDDGFNKIIDIKPFIKNGVSAALRDELLFRQVAVVEGFITWPNGFDFFPEALYEYATKDKVELV